MMRLFKTIALLIALFIGARLALVRIFRRGNLTESIALQGPPNREARAARKPVKRWLFRLTGFGILAAFGGFVLVVSGIVPIKASSGHWPITAWFLDFAMQRSVFTHSLALKPPPLDDRALVLKGAGHYQIGCRPCHGSPELSQLPRIARSMTPHPPELSRQVPKWDAKQLFYIVKHGVKFTGMPAWPAQKRDDEVWAMVAFLLVLPTLTADDYEWLVGAEKSAAQADAPMRDLHGPKPPAAAESCANCHGADGGGRGLGAFPKLAGQKPDYFVASMRAYASGRRSSGIMEPIAVALSQETTAELARYYAEVNTTIAGGKLGQSVATTDERKPTAALSSAQASDEKNPKWADQAVAEDRERAAVSSNSSNRTTALNRGKEIATRGIPPRRVPPCADCHGPSEIPRNRNYPTLAGQYAEYLVLQLALFKSGVRGGTAYAHLMRPVAAGLTPEEMRDVAVYYESLTPVPEERY